MKFKRFQELRDKTIERVNNNETIPIEKFGDLSLYDSLSLAYIGDSVYSMYVREKVIMTGITKVRVIHDVVTKIICAKAQAKAYLELESILTETELNIGRRARNSNVSVPKSAEVWEYRCSTALEALFGYLYLKKEHERLEMLCNIAIKVSLESK